jgi:hypothetical protein
MRPPLLLEPWIDARTSQKRRCRGREASCRPGKEGRRACAHRRGPASMSEVPVLQTGGWGFPCRAALHGVHPTFQAFPSIGLLSPAARSTIASGRDGATLADHTCLTAAGHTRGPPAGLYPPAARAQTETPSLATSRLPPFCLLCQGSQHLWRTFYAPSPVQCTITMAAFQELSQWYGGRSNASGFVPARWLP